MPKILWMSPFSLHDTSSGSSLRCKSMLLALQKKQYEIWSFSSFIFNNKAGAEQAFGDLNKMFKKDKSPVFVFDEDNIHYIYTRCKNTEEEEMTLGECQLFFNTFKQTLDSFQPDFVMGCGTAPICLSCFAEAKRRGITTVYNLTSCHYRGFLFPNIDLIITDSIATANLYKERDHINVVPCGPFVNPPHVVAPHHKPIFVTMVNPAIEKGVAIFAKIAQVCQTELPDVRFLIVNTREDFASILSYLHTPGKLNEHPFKPNDFYNVYSVELQNNMKAIYSITSVLVMPSIAYESWGLTASEAVLNRIPVLASDIGGLKEAICGHGKTLPLPENSVQDFTSIPTDEEIRPWIEALKELLMTDYNDKQMQDAQRLLNLETSTATLLQAFLPFLEQKEQVHFVDLDIDKIPSDQIKNIMF